MLVQSWATMVAGAVCEPKETPGCARPILDTGIWSGHTVKARAGGHGAAMAAEWRQLNSQEPPKSRTFVYQLYLAERGLRRARPRDPSREAISRGRPRSRGAQLEKPMVPCCGGAGHLQPRAAMGRHLEIPTGTRARGETVPTRWHLSLVGV